MAREKKYPQGCGIYAIEHAETGRRYIGSSEKMEKRLSVHIRMLRSGDHHSSHLQAAWNKYGEDSFHFLCIVRCKPEELLVAEQLEIEMQEAVENGFNMARYADSPMRGRKMSEETKAKMRESHKARKPISEETRERMRMASVEREAKKKEEGFEVSEETRKKLSEAGKGRVVSEETRKKLSASNAGQQLSEEQRMKQKAALTGRKLSDEHREAISRGGYRRWAEINGVSQS